MKRQSALAFVNLPYEEYSKLKQLKTMAIFEQGFGNISKDYSLIDRYII